MESNSMPSQDEIKTQDTALPQHNQVPSGPQAPLSAEALVETESVRGDLFRIMALRIRAVLAIVWKLSKELRVYSKCMEVAGSVLDKLFILNRRHRIKDRLSSLASWLYELVMRLVSEAQRGGGEAAESVSSERRTRGKVDDREEEYGRRRRGEGGGNAVGDRREGRFREDVDDEQDYNEYRNRRDMEEDDRGVNGKWQRGGRDDDFRERKSRDLLK